MLTLLSIAIVIGTMTPMSDSAAAEDLSGGDAVRTWHDVSRFPIHGTGYKDGERATPYARLPADAEGRVPDIIWTLAQHSAGLSIRFKVNRSFAVRWTLTSGNLAMPHMPATGVSGVDVYYREDDSSPWRFDRNGAATGMTTTLEVPLRSETGAYCVYLPLYNGLHSVEIGLPADGAITPIPPDEALPIVFYGTSITQGACASRPGMNYLALIERSLGREVVNLGFSGSAKCEPIMADLLARIDAALYAIDALPNMTEPLIRERFEAFILRLRAARPDTPIVVYDRFVALTGPKTGAYAALDDAMKGLKERGVLGLHYVACRGMLGDDGEGTVDGCHPNDLGHFRQARFMIESLKPLHEQAGTRGVR